MLLLFFVSAGLTKIYAQNDTIMLKNHDRLIGEIKKMENGVLTMETDYSEDDFTISWIEVDFISTVQNCLIILEGGKRLNSELKKGKEKGSVELSEGGTASLVRIENIVYIKPVEKDFISRIDASLSFGFNFTKTNNLKQLTIRSTFGYTGKFWSFQAAYNSVISNQDDAEDIHRTDGDIGMKYHLRKDYFAFLQTDFLANDEQKLKLRLTTKSGMGKYIVHTNHLYFGGGLGLAWNNEQYFDTDDNNRNSMEAFFLLEANMFDIKDFSMKTSLSFYPSLTEKNRLRSDFKLDLKYDLPFDFFIKLGGTYNFDNKPVEGASNNDYVIQTTFGWEL